ncbi:MAG TPA: PAS domain S-box protein [Candidatus Cryosericum sp.]|nr:PAS domain S-box protein [Candidatus Cryosericum sp.]
MVAGLFSSSSYAHNPYAFPMFVSALLVVLFGIYALTQERSAVSKSLLVATVCASIWLAGTGLVYTMRDPDLGAAFYRLVPFFGVSLLCPAVYLLTVSSLGLLREKRRLVLLTFGAGLGFYIGDVLWHWVAIGAVQHFWGLYPVYGPFSLVFLVFFFTTFARSAWLYLRYVSQLASGTRRREMQLLLASLCVAVIGAIDYVPCYPPLEVYPFGYAAILSFVLIQTYAITRYGRATLAEIFHSIEEGILVVDAEGRVTGANAAAERILGIARHTMVGRPVRSVLTLIEGRLDNKEAVQDLLAALDSTASQTMERDVGLHDPGVQLRVSVSPLVGRLGSVTGTVLTLTDITERKRLEDQLVEYKDHLERMVDQRTEELRVSMETYRTLVTHAQVGIAIHQNGIIMFANEQMLRLSGYPIEELIGTPIARLIDPQEVDAIMQRARDRVNGRAAPESYEMRFMAKDGTIKPTTVSNALIEYQGKTATLVTIFDVTDSKLRRELEMANHELEMFAYSVSHDLRAPLRSIDGFSQALMEDCGDQLSADAREDLARIRAATQRMASLIDSILQLSRLGRAEMKRQQLDLSAMAEEIASNLRTSEPDRDVELSVHPGVTAVGDGTLLRAVLENLLGNAWKFTRRHEHAHIEFGTVERDGKQTYFVRDDGAGFDMKYADKLFTPFQRLHSVAEFPGTGIGLATVQRIIRRHGGDIWVESAVEKGTTFYFTLQ